MRHRYVQRFHTQLRPTVPPTPLPTTSRRAVDYTPQLQAGQEFATNTLATPAAGILGIYTKDGLNFYTKDATGTETQLGAGSTDFAVPFFLG